MSTRLLPVILAGGGGTRLWPLSRQGHPKQFLNFGGDDSFLQMALSRLRDFNLDGVQSGNPMVICNEEHRFLVAEHARRARITLTHLVLEPVGRNTAPALTLGALLARREDQDPVLLMMPADHLIGATDKFHRAVQIGLQAAASGQVVCFGVPAAHPETGYGYIEPGGRLENPLVSSVQAFHEKPAATLARQYCNSGFLWNAGIFMMKASVWLEHIAKLRPDILIAVTDAAKACTEDGDFTRPDAALFSACPAESIDYAVMEPLAAQHPGSCAVVKLDAKWSDVGSWASLHAVLDKDEQGNANVGDTLCIDTENSMILSERRLVAAIGCKEMVVAETADAVLVAPLARAQEVRAVVDALAQANRSEHESHRRAYRPWGEYDRLDEGEHFQVKRITVAPGHALSLQLHRHRAEHWIVVSGVATVRRGDEEFKLVKNESTYIPVGEKHRLSNPGDMPLEIIEVQSGSYLGEDDIERFEDDYQRLDDDAR